MDLALIICTYKRCESIKKLMDSIKACSKIPDSIIIVDGSPDEATKDFFKNLTIEGAVINYYQVTPEVRGLTRQRNYGLRELPNQTEIVAFLDDDLIIEPDYFKQLTDTFKMHPDAIGVGGIDLKDNRYFIKAEGSKYNRFLFYELDGWVAKESLRYSIRRVFGLMTDLRPGLIPDYSNGRSAFPPNGRTYSVEHFMGGIAAYRRALFYKIKFSHYFEGYGLYEDFDFCVRALPYGSLYVNTNAKVWHYHEPSGRPDFFNYGKMVVRNGWYVWRQKFPNPSLSARIKWNLIMLLLLAIRFINIFTGPARKNAFYEFSGRLTGWCTLFFGKPEVIR